ncbi:hypothetical protein IC580_22900 [Cupriavidus sp. ISTL7]|nr:hypothetical protein IC580_22900 [Cupriavidus sp. ISTL7]
MTKTEQGDARTWDDSDRSIAADSPPTCRATAHAVGISTAGADYLNRGMAARSSVAEIGDADGQWKRDDGNIASVLPRHIAQNECDKRKSQADGVAKPRRRGCHRPEWRQR